ncbi:hypothetical protein Mpop_5465 (plasmid) [Methylorubrum populi BJ001]|uniref:Uncharacterized protein n=1 Tax=Methylorubrum populi (strain ATCC BAA-705 / NCIMB 13946 / BJ001) TaxID=441620 RepID=B1ZM81_METPB|nr:hypothetical protein [Methylorubrum populi]ACB83554.1 hypothetical protein Mpop_5465 [Methylorubrum populi BJ001]
MTREEEFNRALAQRQLADERAHLEAHARYLARIGCKDRFKLAGLRNAFDELARKEARQ